MLWCYAVVNEMWFGDEHHMDEIDMAYRGMSPEKELLGEAQ